MTTGRIIAVVLGVICVILAVVYLVSPQTVGGPTTQGNLMPQAGMPGGSVSFSFTKIPLGIGELTVPIFSAVAIFGILGAGLLVAGLTSGRKEGS